MGVLNIGIGFTTGMGSPIFRQTHFIVSWISMLVGDILTFVNMKYSINQNLGDPGLKLHAKKSNWIPCWLVSFSWCNIRQIIKIATLAFAILTSMTDWLVGYRMLQTWLSHFDGGIFQHLMSHWIFFSSPGRSFAMAIASCNRLYQPKSPWSIWKESSSFCKSWWWWWWWWWWWSSSSSSFRLKWCIISFRALCCIPWFQTWLYSP